MGGAVPDAYYYATIIPVSIGKDPLGKDPLRKDPDRPGAGRSVWASRGPPG